jgi:eukaryotic-like serine/threonine-protein kinase
VAQPGESHEPRLLTASSPSAIGEVLAERYELLEHIGDDSLGRQLYRGIDVVLRRPVAVVMRHPGGDSAREMLGAAVAASRIVHPHLVGVYDAIDEHERAYVVREWVDGIALRDIVASSPLDAGRAVAIAWAVTDAVAGLHETGMAHGNIHPGTVLVANDGRVVLTDARTDDAATPENDIRAIGAVIYCALTGYWPHVEAGPTSVPDGMRDNAGALAAPRQVRAGVPTALDALTADLLNPELPLPTADALATELAGFAQVEQEAAFAAEGALDFDAFSSTTQPVAAPSPAGRKLAVGVVGLLVLALAGTLAAARVLGQDSPSPPVGGQPSGAPAPAKVPSGQPSVIQLKPEQVRIIDPDGNRTEVKDADKTVDGDPGTGWRTERYTRAEFGGNKAGMGVWIDLGEAKKVVSVQVQLSRAGATGELRTGTTDPGAGSTGDKQVVAQYKVVGRTLPDMNTTALFPGGDEPSRYLLIWLTKLPADGTGRYQVTVGEITVRVQ